MKASHNMESYMIVRKFYSGDDEIIKTGLTLKEAKAHCKDPETSSRTCTSEENIKLTDNKGPWFDAFEQE
jgi:hypothetical protein